MSQGVHMDDEGNMLERVTNGVTSLIENNKIKDLIGKTTFDLVRIIFSKDPSSYIDFFSDTSKLLWQLPNAIFWDKMYRFLIGTYSDYECQIKMCQKFQEDTKHYKEFVKKQIQIIDKLDFDCKVEWFSNLTRARLMELISENEYFKLSFALKMISAEDLLYIKTVSRSKDIEENSVLSLFYQHSLVDKFTPTTSGYSVSEYNISVLGKKLLRFGITFGENDEM